jgi:hypothetical protein
MHQAEARRLVVGERKAADHVAVVGGEPDGARLGDEVADGEHEAVVADHHAAAGALGAEHLRRERVLGNLGAQADDAIERRVEIEAPLLGPRPHLDRKGPFTLFLCHR